MIHLLLDCGIFVPLDASKGIFYQLSGMIGQLRAKAKGHACTKRQLTSRAGLPLSGLEKINNSTLSAAKKQSSVLGPSKIKHLGLGGGRIETRPPNSIIFLRRRVLYYRLAGGSKQKLPFGLGSSRKFILTTP